MYGWIWARSTALFGRERGACTGALTRQIGRFECPWRGNVRELRNVIENAVIRSQGEKLDVRLPDEKGAAPRETLNRKQIEKQYIQKALERSGWRVKGAGGAAERLEMKPSTLYSMMRGLGTPTRREKVDHST